MKTKFHSSEIAHVWANKSAPYGSAPSAMSFDGDIFKSYSTAIARRISNASGAEAFILNDRGFSNTTQKHHSKVLQAIPGSATVFHYTGDYGTNLAATGSELFDYAIQQAAHATDAGSRATKRKDYYAAEVARWLESAQQINAFFSLRRKVDQKAIDRLAAARKREVKRQAKAEAAARAARAAEQAEALQQWLAGEDVSVYSLSDAGVRFRIEGEELVSTKGARVPLAEAERALRFALARRSKGWRANGEQCAVGMYSLSSISETGVVAGCHSIHWSEVERVAGLLSAVTA